MDKVKIQFMTEISLLKSHLSTLEKDKSELEMQVNSSESSTSQPPSAFQPVPAPAGGPPAPRKILIDQQELFTLQQKVTYLENQNKKLNDMIHTGSASIDSGNILRRQNLEMKKKVFFLESEKKQLTEKVASLHNTIKSMRESKDRMSHDRLKTLQEENISLQDRIRNMEDMFTRKLVDADGKIASTVKENDILRHKLNFIPEALKLVEKFCQTLMTLSTQIQSQEESLVGLKASLLGSGSTLSPISEIMERVLKNHNDIQSLVSAKTPDEQPPSRSTSSFNRHTPTNAPYSALPPVLQHFSPEYISSLQGATSPTNPSPTHLNSGHRTRSQSHSHVSNPVSSMYEVREKISQIFADNLSIKNLIKHFQENLSLRHSEVGKLQGNLFSYQSELKQHLKFLEETHNALMLLWQQELPSEQLNSIQVLENQVETWQDKVYARDMALKDIELQMKEDYESHNKLFLLLKSQLLDQKDENSMQADTLRSKDQYIHEIEERSLNAESELYKLRKEMERVMQEALNVPEGFQLQNHGGNVSELIRLQNEELHRMKTALSDYIFQINQLQAKVETLHRENSLLQHQGIELERHHQQIRDELYTERDYLRKLVEQQLKAEDASDLLKLLKRSQETTRDQREMRKLASELENVKLILREKDMRISELQHQLEIQQLDTLKSMYPPVKSNTGDSMLTQQYPLMVSGTHGFARPRSAGSAEARIPRYMIMDPNHPKVT
jgi:chromosome segregation ATPase